MKNKNSDSLFQECPHMSSDYRRAMDEKDTRKFMREQYQMLQLQRREYKKNTWLLIISIIIAFASLIVSIIALYR
jgi:cell division protein FtsL